MGRYLGPKHKLCRREGVKLCTSLKCPIARRNYPPGIHGPKGHPRMTEYGKQLREKQKAKRIYGLLERQFRNYFKKAFAKTGDTGELFVQFLETRLDNTVFRSGFAVTRQQARQIVSHGHILVNGKKVNIPSYQVKQGDVISVREKSKKAPLFKDFEKRTQPDHIPEWLSCDAKTMSCKVISKPTLEQTQPLFDVKAIVEFYSR